ncbi:hypothetical protein G9A89_020294 [Geosiphon pyriformis]|nr:hypothetical protein G9A89_020294 [Geosiphon pyriformis]
MIKKSILKLQLLVSNSEISIQFRTILTKLPTNDTAANLSTTYLLDFSTSYLSTTVTSNISIPTNTNTITNFNSDWSLGTGYIQNPNFQNYLSLLVTPEDASTNDLETTPKKSINNNIPPATVTNNELLAAIFSFDFETPTTTLLFSKIILNTKLITVMYTDAKIDNHFIKLILDSGSADSIITRQLMDQLGCQVDCATSA